MTDDINKTGATRLRPRIGKALFNAAIWTISVGLLVVMLVYRVFSSHGPIAGGVVGLIVIALAILVHRAHKQGS